MHQIEFRKNKTRFKTIRQGFDFVCLVGTRDTESTGISAPVFYVLWHFGEATRHILD